jgi:hypothetical protein
VIVTFPETVTVHVAPVADVQPDHEVKLLFPAVAGALNNIVVPEFSVTLNDVVPRVLRLVAELP